jgi:hypothetical protein
MATESLYDHAGGDDGRQNSRARTDAELNPLREVPHWEWPR